jgi:predicted peptidase
MKVYFCLFFLALPAAAQFAAQEMMKPFVYTNAQGRTFPYRLSAPQFPAAGKTYPLILFLHGSGECGTDNQRQITVGLPALLATLIKRPDPVIVLAPQCPGTDVDGMWVDRLAMQSDHVASKEPTASLAAALELCRQMVADHQADSNRLYITGLSLGGFGAWDAIQREPGLFVAAIPICGSGDIRRMQEIKRLPVWVFHGRDDKSVPVACSRRMVEALKQAGNRSVCYTEYEAAPHNVWDRTYANPEVAEWLLSQTRVKPWWRFW